MIEVQGRSDDEIPSTEREQLTNADPGAAQIETMSAEALRAVGRRGIRSSRGTDLFVGDSARDAIDAFGADVIIEGLFNSLAESVFIKDRDGRLLFGNETFYRRLGRDRTVLGRTMAEVLPPHLRAASEETDRLVIVEGRTVRAEYQCAHDQDDCRWFETEKSPLRRDGEIVGLLGISRDITERVRDRDRHAALVDDLNHRVRNILASVRALARQSGEADVSPDEFYELIERRVDALASAHGLVHAHARGSLSFLDLVRSVTRGFVGQNPTRLVLRGNDFRLPADLCTPMALILNELSTNALQHGAWSTGRGLVEIAWSIDDESRTVGFRWNEKHGPVPADGAPGRGLELLDRVARTQLRGSSALVRTDDGMQANLEFRMV